jgi:hypothetical protein
MLSGAGDLNVRAFAVRELPVVGLDPQKYLIAGLLIHNNLEFADDPSVEPRVMPAEDALPMWNLIDHERRLRLVHELLPAMQIVQSRSGT